MTTVSNGEKQTAGCSILSHGNFSVIRQDISNSNNFGSFIVNKLGNLTRTQKDTIVRFFVRYILSHTAGTDPIAFHNHHETIVPTSNL